VERFHRLLVLVLFGDHAGTGFGDAGTPLLLAVLALALAAVALGNVAPRLVSFPPSMRYYAGNWATSLWCFREGAEEVLDRHIRKASARPVLMGCCPGPCRTWTRTP
jgi:hypothetical protein